jgi:hypothetical protein
VLFFQLLPKKKKVAKNLRMQHREKVLAIPRGMLRRRTTEN